MNNLLRIVYHIYNNNNKKFLKDYNKNIKSIRKNNVDYLYTTLYCRGLF